MARRSGSSRAGGMQKVPGVSGLLTLLSALVLPLWLLALLGWAVQLAGLAAVQHSQGRRYLQFDWFITSLEFLVLIVMPIYLLARRCTPGIVALKAVVTVLEILRTNVWNNARLSSRDVGPNPYGANFVQVDSITNPGLNAGRSRIDTLFAGYLITSAFNILLLIALGNLPSVSAQDGEELADAYKGQQGTAGMAEPYSTTAVATAGPGETTTTVTRGPIFPGDANGNPANV